MNWKKTSQSPKANQTVLAYDVNNHIYGLVLIASYQDMKHLESCYDYWMKPVPPERGKEVSDGE